MWDLIVSVPDHCLSFYFGYHKYTNHTFQTVNNRGADQTVRMCRLICAFVVRI